MDQIRTSPGSSGCMLNIYVQGPAVLRTWCKGVVAASGEFYHGRQAQLVFRGTFTENICYTGISGGGGRMLQLNCSLLVVLFCHFWLDACESPTPPPAKYSPCDRRPLSNRKAGWVSFWMFTSILKIKPTTTNACYIVFWCRAFRYAFVSNISILLWQCTLLSIKYSMGINVEVSVVCFLLIKSNPTLHVNKTSRPTFYLSFHSQLLNNISKLLNGSRVQWIWFCP